MLKIEKYTMIRKATMDDLDCIKKITNACAAHLIQQGIYQWNEKYPSRETLQNDIQKKEMHVYSLDNEVIGCVVFSHRMDDFYTEIDWLTPHAKQLYVHRLAVHPLWQKKGIAKRLMDFGETKARTENCLSVRLDTFSKNERNNRFYRNRGYRQVGEVFFPQKSTSPFYCYEKKL